MRLPLKAAHVIAETKVYTPRMFMSNYTCKRRLWEQKFSSSSSSSRHDFLRGRPERRLGMTKSPFEVNRGHYRRLSSGILQRLTINGPGPFIVQLPR